MNKEFLTNTINHLEEHLIELGTAANGVLRKANVAPKKKRKFCECFKEIDATILLRLFERLPTNQMLFVMASSLSPGNMTRMPKKGQRRVKKLADNPHSLKLYYY